MIDILIKSGNFLLDVFRSHQDADEKKKEEIADVLEQIAELLEDLHMDLTIDNYPHGTCAELDMLNRHLIKILKNHLEDEYLEILEKSLNSASEIEKMYAHRKDPEQLYKIRVASGYFRAAAVLASI